MVGGERSIFKGTEKLPPAHVLAISASTLTRPARRYWQLRLEPDERPTVDQWQEAIDRLGEGIGAGERERGDPAGLRRTR